MATAEATIRVLGDGTRIYVTKGSKSTSLQDFIVKSKGPAAVDRQRSPSHVHLVVDMFMKRMGNPFITNQLVDYFLDTLVGRATAAAAFPPTLQHVDASVLNRFAVLGAFGEFSVEYVLVVGELVAIAEKTNYPEGTLQKKLWTDFRRGASLYTVMGAARFR